MGTLWYCRVMDNIRRLTSEEVERLFPDAYAAACDEGFNSFYAQPPQFDEDNTVTIDGVDMVLYATEGDLDDVTIETSFEWDCDPDDPSDGYWRDTSRF